MMNRVRNNVLNVVRHMSYNKLLKKKSSHNYNSCAKVNGNNQGLNMVTYDNGAFSLDAFQCTRANTLFKRH